jgi:hypothetical protein
MLRRPVTYDRTVLLLLFLLCFAVALLSLVQIENTAALVLLGIAAVLYLIIRLHGGASAGS